MSQLFASMMIKILCHRWIDSVSRAQAGANFENRVLGFGHHS